MKPRTHLLQLAISMVAFAVVNPLQADVTAGADFELNAGLDTDADDRWEDLVAGNPSGFELLLDDSPAVSRVTATTTTRLSHAYDFPGGSLGNEAGALLVDTGTTTEKSFQNAASGDWSQSDVTIEIWFKPDSLSPSDPLNTNGQTIFEDGGGTGFGFFLDDSNELQLRRATNTGIVSYNLSTDSSSLLLAPATSEFIQAVGTYNVTSGVMELFVNGVSVGTDTPGGADWSGGDGAAFGTLGGVNVGGIGSGQIETESFDGQIALVRVYENQILTGAEVLNNFEALDGITPPADFEVDASLDTDADNRWEDIVAGNPSGAEFLLDDAPAVARVAISGSSMLLSHAYDFPGGAIDTDGGAAFVTTDTTTLIGAEALGWDTQNVMVEIWFRPDTLTPGEANGQILWETGGGSGLGFFIDDNELIFSLDTLAGGNLSYNLASDPDGLLLNSATTEFIQVAGSFVASTGELELFINGVSVGTASTGDNDWSGSDAAALGTRGGSNAGGFGNGSPDFESFDGEVALMRMYVDEIPSAADMLANFEDHLGPDVLPPGISTLTPADNANGGFYVGTDLVLRFGEDVALTGSGTIIIRNLDDGTGSSDVTINLPDPSVTLIGRNLIINPATNLDAGTNYAIRISGDAVEDLAGSPNVFPGIADDAIWNFQTAVDDLVAPTITTYDPVDGTTDAFVFDPIVATFDETVFPGTGNIILRNLSDGFDAVISVTDTSRVSISGNVLTIDPASLLVPGKDYAVRIDAGCVTDISGKPYAGIADDTTWNFTAVGSRTLLSDDFEPGVNPFGGTTPDVATYTVDTTSGQANGALWIRATRGYRATRNGLVDESENGGSNFTDPVGTQAYGFRYTNSAVTSQLGKIGALSTGRTITVSFDAVRDGYNGGLAYGAYLVLFDDGAERWAAEGPDTNTAAVLAQETGSVPDDADYHGFQFSYTVGDAVQDNNGDAGGSSSAWLPSLLGKDIALRFDGATSTANIDNVVVSESIETVAPLLVSIVDDVSGGPVTVPGPVTYTVTFDEAMNAASIGTDDFENGSTAGITVDSVSTTADPAVYEVAVTTTSAGDLRLQVKAGALLYDGAGNPLDTTSAIPDDTTITVTGGAGNTFANWIAGFPGAAGDTSFTGDPDGDGVESGLENFFGTNPGVFSAGLVAGVQSGNTYTFTHPQSGTPANDLSPAAYTWSTDLGTFTSDGGTNGGTTVSFSADPNTPSTGITTVTATVAGTAINKLFVRVGVSQTTP